MACAKTRQSLVRFLPGYLAISFLAQEKSNPKEQQIERTNKFHGGESDRRGGENGGQAQACGERGWTHWHHLFNPRQLLITGQLGATGLGPKSSNLAKAGCLLGIGKCADWNSRLSRWWTDPTHEKVVQTFTNQALNTLMTYGTRGFLRPDDS